MSPNRAAQLIALMALSAAPVLSHAQAAVGVIEGQVSARSPKGRVGVVVHLEKVPGTFRPPAKPAEMDQKKMTFVPHILAVQKGTTVVFKNSDAVSHNIFSPDGEKYNLGSFGQNQSARHTFNTLGVYHQLCNVHPEMGAVIVVLDNPYFAVTAPDGKFKIEGVPPGSYELKTWSEKGPESTRPVTVAAGAPTSVHIELGK